MPSRNPSKQGLLERFAAAQQPQIQRLRELKRRHLLPPPWTRPRPGLADALRQGGPGGEPLAVIAEYKRASPSKGVINLDLTPAEVCGQYAVAGASALSVLTEADHFQGSSDFLLDAEPTGLPILRKDFLLDPLQVVETAATPASALLLIVRMLPGEALQNMLDEAGEAGLEAVVEVFDQADLDRAKVVGASIIQVNNRDLDTLGVDLGVSRALVGQRNEREVWITASGLSTGADLAEMACLGFDAALIGTHLMADGRPGRALARLLADARRSQDSVGYRGAS